MIKVYIEVIVKGIIYCTSKTLAVSTNMFEFDTKEQAEKFVEEYKKLHSYIEGEPIIRNYIIVE